MPLLGLPLRRALYGAILVAALATGTPPTAASAGTYDVLSCDRAPVGGTDDAWTYVTDNAASFTTERHCPSTGDQFSGLTLFDQLRVPVGQTPALGQVAEWRLTAPAGTTITRVRAQRDLGIRDTSFRNYARDASGATLNGGSETCTKPYDEFTCDVGGPGTPEVDMTGLNTTVVRFGIECFDTPTTCGTGATLHSAWAVLYGTTVTITDPTDPTVSSVGGPLFSGGWKRGTVAATATLSDTTGIKTVRFHSDAALIAGSAIPRTCDDSRVVPCSNPAAGASFALDTTKLTDGSHTIQLAALDAAGNEAKGAGQVVKVDNTAPGVPENLTATGGGASALVDLGFDLPAQAFSPLSTAHYRACSGSVCAAGSVPVSGASATINGLVLPVAGTYAVSVWLTDEAGNSDPAHAATTTVAYTPSGGGGGGSGGSASAGGSATGNGAGGSGGGLSPTPPAPSPSAPTPLAPSTPAGPPVGTGAVAAKVTATAKTSKRGRLTITGRIARAARGSVTITYRATIAGRRAVRTTHARITSGRYRARLRLPRRWRQAVAPSVRVRYAGSDTVRAQTTTLRLRSR